MSQIAHWGMLPALCLYVHFRLLGLLSFALPHLEWMSLLDLTMLEELTIPSLHFQSHVNMAPHSVKCSWLITSSPSEMVFLCPVWTLIPLFFLTL